jgi:hypothetical protein
MKMPSIAAVGRIILIRVIMRSFAGIPFFFKTRTPDQQTR